MRTLKAAVGWLWTSTASAAIVRKARDDREPEAAMAFTAARGVEPDERFHRSSDPVVRDTWAVIADADQPMLVVARRHDLDRRRAVLERVVDQVRHEPVEQACAAA